VYCIGGFDNRDLSDCEKFNGTEWSAIKSLPEPLTKMGVAEYREELWCAGWPSQSIFAYNVLSKEWRDYKQRFLDTAQVVCFADPDPDEGTIYFIRDNGSLVTTYTFDVSESRVVPKA
jgi:hypothetical protein